MNELGRGFEGRQTDRRKRFYMMYRPACRSTDCIYLDDHLCLIWSHSLHTCISLSTNGSLHKSKDGVVARADKRAKINRPLGPLELWSLQGEIHVLVHT